MGKCDIFKDLPLNSHPTHVVTAISYGGKAIFSFKKVNLFLDKLLIVQLFSLQKRQFTSKLTTMNLTSSLGSQSTATFGMQLSATGEFKGRDVDFNLENYLKDFHLTVS